MGSLITVICNIDITLSLTLMNSEAQLAINKFKNVNFYEKV